MNTSPVPPAETIAAITSLRDRLKSAPTPPKQIDIGIVDVESYHTRLIVDYVYRFSFLYKRMVEQENYLNERLKAEKRIETYRYTIENIESWGFIPSEAGYLYNILRVINHHKIDRGKRILDLGCGYSSVLSLLKILGFKHLIGVEYQESLVNQFNSVFKTDIFACDHKCIKGNLLSIDEKTDKIINCSDLIYNYQPIRDIKRYLEMIKDVANRMRVGSILVGYYGGMGAALTDDPRFEKVYDGQSYPDYGHGAFKKISV